MPAPRLLHARHQLATRVRELGAELTDVIDDGAVFIGVLKGCLPFLADLVRHVHRDVRIDFMALSAFAPDSGRVRLTRDVETELAGRQVVLVEDVVDTGFRLDFLLRHVRDREPADLRVCTLFDRTARRVLPATIDHVGFDLASPFVIGYGIDHQGCFRNLPDVVELDLSALDADPDGIHQVVHELVGERTLAVHGASA